MKTKLITNNWKEIELGNKNYFKILGSGIKEFEGEKDYLSTESIKGTKIEKIECKIKYNNRPSRANMQPVINSIWFAKMQATLKVYAFTKNNDQEVKQYILSTGFAGIGLNKNISPDYIRLYFTTKRFNLEKDKLCTGSTQRGINNSFIIKIKILLPFLRDGTPNLKEQERIIKILEKAEKLKERGKNANDLLDEYLKSVFNEMFYNKGFEEIELGDKKICIVSGEYGSGASAINYNGKTRYIRITDITENGTLKKEKVSPSKTEEKYLLQKGDLLFARSGATVGKTYLYNSDKINYQYAGYLIRYRFNHKIIPEYIYYFTKTPLYLAWINSKQKVVAQPNINAKQYSSLKIPLPPLPLQQKFAKIVEHVEKMKEDIKKTQQNSEELFNSLTQKAFRGEL